MEEWRDIAGYEGLYQVSNLGRVRSLNYRQTKRRKILKSLNKEYKSVGLYKDNKSKMLAIHRLVAEAFIPNIDNLPCVNHIDKDKHNNNANNLEWCTCQYNTQYSKAIPVIQYDLQDNYIQEFVSSAEAQRKTKIGRNHICECCKGKRKTAGGYVWRYKD